MHISEFQDLMKALYFDQDKKRGSSKTFLWIIEEIGELAESLRNYQDSDKNKNELEKVKQEMADVIAWTLSLANILDINLEKALYKKYPAICPKCKRNPCACNSQ